MTGAHATWIRSRTFAVRSLIALGLVLVLFVAYEYEASSIAQARSQSALLAQFRQRLATPGFDAANRPLEPGAIALLEIPTLGLRQVVVEGSTPTDLQQGPGHLSGTPLPGEYGNAVIVGHRSLDGAPFAGLGRLRPHDRLVAVTGQGRFTYVVDRVETVAPGAGDVIGPARAGRLTLVTSNGTTSPDRLAVIASLVGRPVGVPARPGVPMSPDELGTSGDLLGLFEAIGWAQLLIVAGLLATVAFRRWPARAAYMISVPPMLALLLLVFSNLDRFLPGTL